MVKIVTLHDEVAYGFFFESSRKLLNYLRSPKTIPEIKNAFKDLRPASLDELINKHVVYNLIETSQGKLELTPKGNLIAQNSPNIYNTKAEIFLSENNRPPKNPLMALIALYYGYNCSPSLSIVTGIIKASINQSLTWLSKKGLAESEKTGKYYRYYLNSYGKRIAEEIEPKLTRVEDLLYKKERRILLRSVEQRMACLRFNHPELFRQSHEQSEQYPEEEPTPDVIKKIKEPVILSPFELDKLAEEFGPEDWI